MRFGIHVPRQGTLAATARYARDIGCETCQIFSGNPVGWEIGTLRTEDRDQFRSLMSEAAIAPVLVHAPYLVNLASPDGRLARLSERGLLAAVRRADELGAGPVVVHAGNHMGGGAEAGIERAIRVIGSVLERAPAGARLALEGGVGKGTEIGVTFDELSRLMEPFPARRVGVVLDTAHLWGLGYDLRNRDDIDSMIAEFDRGPGLARLCAIHGNDSLAERGSRRDRHALWSDGRMGRPALRNIVRAPALAACPLVFEVPGKTPAFDRARLQSMRRMERRLRRAD
jgi:deoxyribonuclease-4